MMELAAHGTRSPSQRRCLIFPICASILSAIGGFLFGYDTGVISGALIQLREHFQLTYVYQELIVSVTLIASAFAALVSGSLTDRLGRKIVIVLSTLVFTVGAVVLGSAVNKETLIIGRLIVGVGIGMASMIVPVYIAEIAPKTLRGPLVTLNIVCVTGGQFIAAVVDGIFISNPLGWRYMLGLAGVPSLIQFVGFVFMPETPRWLVEHGRIDDARTVLQRIYDSPTSTPDIEDELNAIKAAADGENSERLLHNSSTVEILEDVDDTAQILPPQEHCCRELTIVRMLRQSHTRRALAIGCGIQGFQQLVGINTVMYYGSSILSMSGLGAVFSSHLDANFTVVWLSTLVAFTNFFFSLTAPWLISRFRRRTILLVSLAGVLSSLAILSISFQLMSSFSSPVDVVEPTPLGQLGEQCLFAKTCDSCVQSTKCGFCYEVSPVDNTVVNGSCLPMLDQYAPYSAYGRCSRNALPTGHSKWMTEHCQTPFGWLTLVGLILYLAFFAPGMAAVPWAIVTEIFPTWARGTGMACSTASNWIANVIVSVSFLSLTDAITRQGTFLLYVFITVFAIIFVSYMIPETGDFTLEEVQTNFESRNVISGGKEREPVA